MNANEFNQVLFDDAAQDARRAAGKDLVRAIVFREPLPVLAINLIENLKKHLDVLQTYIEKRHDIDSTWN